MLNKDDIIFIHNIAANKYGILNDNIDSCFASIDYYDSIEEKISSIVRAIIKNHYFIDGNKRTALAVYYTLCKTYNLPLKYDDDDLGKVLEDISEHKYSVKEIRNILF